MVKHWIGWKSGSLACNLVLLGLLTTLAKRFKLKKPSFGKQSSYVLIMT